MPIVVDHSPIAASLILAQQAGTNTANNIAFDQDQTRQRTDILKQQQFLQQLKFAADQEQAKQENARAVMETMLRLQQIRSGDQYRQDTLDQRKAEFDYGKQQDAADVAAYGGMNQPNGAMGPQVPGSTQQFGPPSVTGAYGPVSPEVARQIATVQGQQQAQQMEMQRQQQMLDEGSVAAGIDPALGRVLGPEGLQKLALAKVAAAAKPPTEDKDVTRAVEDLRRAQQKLNDTKVKAKEEGDGGPGKAAVEQAQQIVNQARQQLEMVRNKQARATEGASFGGREQPAPIVSQDAPPIVSQPQQPPIQAIKNPDGSITIATPNNQQRFPNIITAARALQAAGFSREEAKAVLEGAQ